MAGGHRQAPPEQAVGGGKRYHYRISGSPGAVSGTQGMEPGIAPGDAAPGGPVSFFPGRLLIVFIAPDCPVQSSSARLWICALIERFNQPWTPLYTLFD
jgi:hypothetical protein